ncbi:MAG: DUF4870 domain-containing protein [Phycisphaerales bacterium]|nr:DUF4870 domain-containing protein [Phycisphaerales bacterium]
MDAAMHMNERNRWVDDASTADERMFSTFTHLSLLAHLVLPYISILIPIIMWSMKKKESAYIADHGREAVNFQISLAIYSILLPIIAIPIGLLLFVVGVAITVPLAALFPYVLGLVGMIIAAVASNRGELYRYPMTIRFLTGR